MKRRALRQNETCRFRDLPLEISTVIASFLPRAETSGPEDFAHLFSSYPLRIIRVWIFVSQAWAETSASSQLPQFITQSMAHMSIVDLGFRHPTVRMDVRLMALFSNLAQVKSIAVHQHNDCVFHLRRLESSLRMNRLLRLHQLRLYFFYGPENDTVQMRTARAISSIVVISRSLQYLQLCSELALKRKIFVESGLSKALMASNLRHLLLTNVGLDADSAVEVSNILSGQHSLVLLDCSYNSLGDQGVLALATSLETNTSLRLLALTSVGMTGLSGQALAKVLCTNSNLKVLLLDCNKLGSQCGLVFAQMLESNYTLRILVLTQTRLGADGCRSFIKALRINRQLKRLYAANNGVSLKDRDEMIRVAKEGKSLKVLQVADKNELSGELQRYAPNLIVEFLRHNGVYVF